jgi:hypothetical protein
MATTDKKYCLVQLPLDVHKLLKDYTKHHGYTMSGYLSNLIRKDIKGKKNEKN